MIGARDGELKISGTSVDRVAPELECLDSGILFAT